MPEEPGRLTRLDRVLVGVRDLAAATGAYARLLGRSPSWRGEQPAAGTADAAFRLANTCLELRAPEGEGEGARALGRWLDRHGEGPLGLVFATADAQACRSALAGRDLAPGPVEPGLDRDVDSGAFRTWRGLALPPERTRGVSLSAVEPLSPAEVMAPAPALADEAAAVEALDHAVIRTADPDAASRLYAEGLGLRLALDRRFERWGVRLVFFRVGGVTVELAAALHPSDSGTAKRDPDRLWGLSWRVPDAGAARARLAAAGIDVSGVRPGRRPGTRVFSVRDGTCGVATLMLEGSGRRGRSSESSGSSR